MSATDRTASWPQRARSTWMAGLCAILPIAPSAQPAQAPKPIVSEADVARAAKSQPVITDQDIERAAKKNACHRRRTGPRAGAGGPEARCLPQPLTQRRIDLGAIAKGYEAMGQPAPGAAAINGAPALLVFVSFSMPDATLARLVDQAARARATLVLRGLVDGSLQKTVLRAQALIGQRKVGFQIDPQAFDRFSITAAPTFVLLKAGAVAAPCAAGTCFPASSFVAAAGDVSIDYALEYFRRAAPSFSRDAGVVLAALKKGGP
ncbi:MAG: type-F conjugative transfer system pilin assembly protein TrbC [Betaproteobacteria bacterium]|nr:type-F conjugative transfer system pilin assembly protein TrbC [Betaproteobacteria bacterium]